MYTKNVTRKKLRDYYVIRHRIVTLKDQKREMLWCCIVFFLG